MCSPRFGIVGLCLLGVYSRLAAGRPFPAPNTMDSPRREDEDRDYRRRSRSPEARPPAAPAWESAARMPATVPDAVPLSPSGGNDEGNKNPGNNLFVSGVSNRVQNDDLQTLFERYGRIEKVSTTLHPTGRANSHPPPMASSARLCLTLTPKSREVSHSSRLSAPKMRRSVGCARAPVCDFCNINTLVLPRPPFRP